MRQMRQEAIPGGENSAWRCVGVVKTEGCAQIQKCPDQGVSTAALLTFGAREVLGVGDCPVHAGISQHPYLHH